MSQHQPALTDYPGYFPPRKPPFWTRAKVGTATGVAGLILGASLMGGNAAEPADITISDEQPAALAPSVENSDAAETDDLREELSQLKVDNAGVLAKMEKRARTAQKKAVRRAVATARADEHAKATAAIAQARADAQAQIRTFAGNQPAVPATPSTDPHFGTCGEANDSGYGSYVRGQDPEYDWYDDRDNDGIVCEY